MSEGSHNNWSVTATDEAGNTGSAANSTLVQIDQANSVITFDNVAFTDTGVQGDHITSNSTVALSGTTQDNVTVSQVEMFNAGVSLGQRFCPFAEVPIAG